MKQKTKNNKLHVQSNELVIKSDKRDTDKLVIEIYKLKGHSNDK